MKKTLWNEDTILKEALKYKTRNEFKKNSGSAYSASRKLKIHDIVCSHMVSPLKKYTKEECVIKSLQYKTRKDFRFNEYEYYSRAKNKKWLEEVCSHMILLKDTRKRIMNNFTKEECIVKSLKYDTRSEFREKDYIYYNRAKNKKWLDEVCSHIPYDKKHIGYTKEECIEKASLCLTKVEFKLKYNGYYCRTYDLNIMEEASSHMIQLNRTSDTIYIWKAIGEKWNDKQLYKIGITIFDDKYRRIKNVAKKLNCDYKIITFQKIKNVFKVEQKLLKSISKEINFTNSFDGSTEFRSWDEDELNQALKLIDEY